MEKDRCAVNSVTRESQRLEDGIKSLKEENYEP